MKRLLAMALVATFTIGAGAKGDSGQLPYQNPKLPIDMRINDLLSRMNL